MPTTFFTTTRERLMADYGFAVKKPGVNKNVEDCTSLELAASSKFNCFKVAYEGQKVFTISTTDFFIPRQLVPVSFNFNPASLVYCEINPGQWYPTTNAGALSNYVRFLYESDDRGTGNYQVNVWFYILPGSTYTSSHDFTVKYFVFGDTVDEVNTESALPDPTDFGIKVMKQGFDATTDNYIEHLIWSSSVPPMKVAKIASVSEAVPATATTSFTIPHSSGYAPAFMVFRERTPGSGQYNLMPFGNLKSSTDIGEAEAYVTDSNLVITERNPGAAKTVNYRYILFAERLD